MWDVVGAAIKSQIKSYGIRLKSRRAGSGSPTTVDGRRGDERAGFPVKSTITSHNREPQTINLYDTSETQTLKDPKVQTADYSQARRLSSPPLQSPFMRPLSSRITMVVMEGCREGWSLGPWSPLCIQGRALDYDGAWRYRTDPENQVVLQLATLKGGPHTGNDSLGVH